jgi:MFS family permease
VLIPFSPNIEAIYSLRLLQGLAGGLIIPLLMATAFRVLTPNIRLYSLAVCALTATFTPRWPQRWPRFGLMSWIGVSCSCKRSHSALWPAFSCGTACIRISRDTNASECWTGVLLLVTQTLLFAAVSHCAHPVHDKFGFRYRFGCPGTSYLNIRHAAGAAHLLKRPERRPLRFFH